MDELHSFGAWVQRRRRVLLLTQAELARRIGIATITLQKIEADARRPSRQVAALLMEHLQISVHEAERFLAVACGQRPTDELSNPIAVNAPGTRMPVQLTSFHGRAQVIADLVAVLTDTQARLITLTGAGGIGKTRLAVQVADAVAPHYRDGTWFVDLSPLRDPEHVAAAILQTLPITAAGGTPPRTQLIGWLRAKSLLLLLDNFEQLVEAAPLVGEVLQDAPGVQMLVTSRIPLQIAGEQEYPVAPLKMPSEEGAQGSEEIQAYDAIRLFVDRARQVKPSFALTEANVRAMAELCRRLDGLPLAIELAAARVRLLTPEQLLTHMRSVGTLAILEGGRRDVPDRQRTMRATIDWSYRLLTAAEQAFLVRLGVFVGGFTLEAAEAIWNVPRATALATLATLVEQNLVRPSTTRDEARFALLEMVREYALEQLVARSELVEAQQRHLEYYVAFAERAEQRLTGPEQITWLEQLEVEYPNLRSAVTAAAGPQQAVLAARLCIALYQFWVVRRSHIREGLQWLEQVLAAGDTLPEAQRAWAFFAAGDLLGRIGEDERAQQLVAQSLALFSQLNDARGLAATLVSIADYEHDPARAVELIEESLALARSQQDRQATAWALLWLGMATGMPSTQAGKRQILAECLALYRATGHAHGTANALLVIGDLAFIQGDYVAARRYNEERLAIETALKNSAGIANCFLWFGMIALAQGEHEEARTHFAEQVTHLHTLGLEHYVALGSIQLAYVAATQGQPEQARAILAESLRGFSPEQDAIAGAVALDVLALCAVAEGSEVLAARLYGVAETLVAIVDSRTRSWGVKDRFLHEHAGRLLRTQLDHATFTEGVSAGHMLSWEQAVAEAQSTHAGACVVAPQTTGGIVGDV